MRQPHHPGHRPTQTTRRPDVQRLLSHQCSHRAPVRHKHSPHGGLYPDSSRNITKLQWDVGEDEVPRGLSSHVQCVEEVREGQVVPVW